MPTGEGKTLLALLIADHALSRGWSVAYLTGTRQLTERVEEEAETLGLDVVRFASKDYGGAKLDDYHQAQTVGVMNYWVYFNSSAIPKPADLVIFDDAHLAEQPLSGLQTLRIPNKLGPARQLYQTICELAHTDAYPRLRAMLDGTAQPGTPPESYRDRRPGAPLRGHEEGNGDPPAGRTGRSRLGRSRGGLTTKIHLACDGKGRPLAILLTPGQRHDSICARPLLERIRVPRTGQGRPRRRPDQVVADKAYSSRGFRAYLRRRGIACTIPEKDDQQRHRHNRGRHGGRPPAFDRQIYFRRNVVERCFNQLKGFRGIATRYDKTATSYEAAVSLASILLWARSV